MLRHRTHLALFTLAPLAAAVLVAAPARATDPAAAQGLFNEARDLIAQGRYAQACPKLEASEKLDPGMGTEFNLANCYQHTGRVASAWATFIAVAAEARVAGQPAREKVARDRAAALEGTLPKVMVLVHGGDMPGLEVQRDGAPLGREQWGVALPTDPGPHTITARVPGRPEWRQVVDVPITPGIVSVDVPAIGSTAPAPLPKAVVVATPPPAVVPPPTHVVVTTEGVANEMPPQPPPVVVEEHRGNGQRVAGGIIGVLGLGSIVAGIVTGLDSKSRHDEALDHCVGNVCDATGVSLRHDAVVFGDVSTVTFIAGGAALLGGIIIFAAAPTSTTTVRAAPMVGAGTSGISVSGAF